MRELLEADPGQFKEAVEAGQPVVFRGIVSGWPAVRAGLRSPDALRSYLARFDRGAPVEAFVAHPEVGGRFFYDETMRGFNFQRVRAPLADVTARIAADASAEPKIGIYVGSTPVAQLLPGFEAENDLSLVRGKPTEPRMWLGNQSVVAPHFDESNNVACVVAGRRRFTLFPPDQVSNLYVGPIDITVAGQPASMVDVRAPDFEAFPRFRDALAVASVAELEAGDAIYIPALWWHHVEALDTFNVLVNYWWQDSPPDAGSPFACLGHGLLTIAHLPKPQRDAWRALFDHYVFRRDGDPAAHIPEPARGVLGETSAPLRRMMKDFLRRAIGPG